MPKFPKFSPVTTIIVFGIITALSLGFLGYKELFASFDQKRASGTEGFQLKDTLICEIQHSTHRSGRGPFLPYLEEKSFTLDRLNTESPTIQGFNLQVEYKGNDYLILRSKPIERFSETVGILTTNGTFTRTIIGTSGLYGNDEFHYAVAQKGRCK